MSKRDFVDDKPRSEWERLIMEWVHDEVNRQILRRNLLDGVSIEKVSEEIGLSPRYTLKRFDKAKRQLLCHL